MSTKFKNFHFHPSLVGRRLRLGRASELASVSPPLPLSDDRVISQRWRRSLVPSAGPPVARLLNVIGDTIAATRHPSTRPATACRRLPHAS